MEYMTGCHGQHHIVVNGELIPIREMDVDTHTVIIVRVHV